MSGSGLQLTAYVDGGARGNPGPAGVGVVLVDDADGEVLHERGRFLGRATNNVAEYQALLTALETAAELGADALTVRSDSELLVRQMTGQYRVRNAGLRPLWARAGELAGGFQTFRIEHVRREKNAHADRLANQAMNLRQDVYAAE